MTALIGSKHYLRPGQKPWNPTAPPKGKLGQKGQVPPTFGHKWSGKQQDPGIFLPFTPIGTEQGRQQKNPKAEQAVYHALTIDPNVEKVTEGLIHDWTSSADLGKRDAYAEAEADASLSEEWEA
ncbi:hypothetical protein MMC14_008151 [Varicellaria rhodocarpa]|nr:hypothetical protein [Varicellaria rhodocarpa]